MAQVDVRRMRQRASSLLEGFTTGQKTMMGLAVVAVIAGLLLFSRNSAPPSMAALYSNLEASDASAVTAKLDAQGVKYELTNGGATIMVPSADLYKIRLDMSAAGLPSGGSASWSLIDKQGITTSQFRQRVDYQRALSGELGRTIEAMEPIQKAIVNLVIPPDDAFAVDTTKASASVLLKTTGDVALDEGQVRSILNLVSSSVPGLTPQAVSITDGKGNTLWELGQDPNAAGSGGVNANVRTAQFEQKLRSELESTLAAVTGPGKVKVTINADLDLDSRTTQTVRHAQPNGQGQAAVPISAKRETEVMNSAGSAVVGPLGPDGQPLAGGATTTTVAGATTTTVPGSSTTVTIGANGGTYQHSTEDVQYAVDEVQEVVQAVPGKINRLTVAVLVDDKAVPQAMQPQIEEIVKQSVGYDENRGDKFTVQRIKFDTTAADAAAKQLQASAGSSGGGGLTSLIRMIGTLLVVLLALVFAFLSLRKAAKRAPKVTPINVRELIESDPELREMLQLPTGEALGELPAAADGEEDDTPRLEPIKVSRDALLVQQMEGEITNMLETQPEDVAKVVRNWLGERRGGRR